jgi:hypothetical protein
MEAKQFTPSVFGMLLVKFKNDANEINNLMRNHVGTTPWFHPIMASLVQSWGPDVRKHMVRILVDCLIDQIETVAATTAFDWHSSRMLRQNLGMVAVIQDMLFVEAVLLMANPLHQGDLFIGKSEDVKSLCMSLVIELLRTLWFTQMIIDRRINHERLHLWMNWGVSPISHRLATDLPTLSVGEVLDHLSTVYSDILRSPSQIEVAQPPDLPDLDAPGMSICDAREVYKKRYQSFTRHWEATDVWISRHLGERSFDDKIGKRSVLKKRFDEEYTHNLMVHYGLSDADG